MKIRELLAEAAAPAVGRKYQHIEDLVFTNGSDGGLHAVERLRSMGQQGGTIELKWDGSPVIYWGRDEQNRFSMIPKNAWEYLKRGKSEVAPGVPTAMYSPEDIKNFVLGTGKPGTPEQATQRQAFAQELMDLWPYFESVSPKRGYVEGGLLFYPSKPAQLNPQTQEYDFTPNITAFHIPVGSKLGQRIKNAKIMVAVTGFYDTLGSGEEGRYPNAEQLSTPDVIVQGTTYVEKAPGVEDAGLTKAEQFISTNAAAIDMFLAPKPGLSKPGDILYKFYNQNLRIPGVKNKFQEWVTANVSAGQAQKILADQTGLNAVLHAVEMLSREKLQMINKLSAGTHGDIRQTKPEGYVQAHPGTPFKKDLPGQFVKAIDQANWAPRRD
jgi:hypothetical protein